MGLPGETALLERFPWQARVPVFGADVLLRCGGDRHWVHPPAGEVRYGSRRRGRRRAPVEQARSVAVRVDLGHRASSETVARRKDVGVARHRHAPVAPSRRIDLPRRAGIQRYHRTEASRDGPRRCARGRRVNDPAAGHHLRIRSQRRRCCGHACRRAQPARDSLRRKRSGASRRAGHLEHPIRSAA